LGLPYLYKPVAVRYSLGKVGEIKRAILAFSNKNLQQFNNHNH